jgi:hypothetical protein
VSGRMDLNRETTDMIGNGRAVVIG